MSRKNWSKHVEPHICRHPDDEVNPIEWCICPLDEDHYWDDLRIEPHECAHPAKQGEPGWWQNPVTQKMRSES
jgi:hypothetical protein